MEIDHDQEKINKLNEKLGKVLDKLLLLKFQLKNEIYLNLLFTYLFDQNDFTKTWIQPNEQLKEKLSIFVIDTINLWEKQRIVPPPQILSFVLNLAGEISCKEKVFVNLNSQNVYESLVDVSEKCLETNASVKFGFINLLYNFLEHKCGVQWILCTNHWVDIVNLGSQISTIYINRKVNEFVVRLLQKTITFNRNFCIKLINLLTKPFKDFLESTKTTNSNENQTQQELFDALKPHLNFMEKITELILKTSNDNICDLFLELEIPDLLRQLLPHSQSEELSLPITKNILNLLFFKLHKSNLHGSKHLAIQQGPLVLDELKYFLNIINGEIGKGHAKCVLKLCSHSFLLWSYIKSTPLFLECRGEHVEFQHQMILIHLMPIMMSSIFFLGDDIRVTEEIYLNDDYRRHYVNKWMKRSAIETLKMCYNWMDTYKVNMSDDLIFALQLIVNMQKLLDKERAALFFQPLIYSLHDSLIYLAGDCLGNMSEKLVRFMDALIEAIICLVKTFDITWKDSIETISVLKLTCEYLRVPYLVDKLIIKGLKLLDMAISKHMSPDMILLIDNQNDSLVTQTGSLLYVKCHNSLWEIRDTALEVVCTLSANANTRFPAFKNILLDANLPNLVIQMALHDGEFYVRATALKCLQELIQINDIWQSFQTSDNFYHNILDIFDSETEGIVRKEAAILIYTIHKHQEFPNEILSKLYDVMAHAAIDDFYWEVKLNALKFWFYTGEKLLTDQGMIDRHFPTVTFSREQKKIITLNDMEIRKRLTKVLYHLNEIGGLYVLKMATEDDSDLEVTKLAVTFSKKLLGLLKKYKLDAESIDILPKQMNESNHSAKSSTSTSNSDLKCPHMKENDSQFIQDDELMECDSNVPVMKGYCKFDSLQAEKILDELLDSNDITLLQDTYNPNMNNEKTSKQTRSQVIHNRKRKHSISPYEYVQFIYSTFETKNCEEMIAEEKAGEHEMHQLNDIISLLDDILQDCDQNLLNINNMDCY